MISSETTKGSTRGSYSNCTALPPDSSAYSSQFKTRNSKLKTRSRRERQRRLPALPDLVGGPGQRGIGAVQPAVHLVAPVRRAGLTGLAGGKHQLRLRPVARIGDHTHGRVAGLDVAQ